MISSFRLLAVNKRHHPIVLLTRENPPVPSQGQANQVTRHEEKWASESLSKPGMHWLSVLSYAFILHIRNPARQQREKKSKFQRTPNALPPLDITPLSTFPDAKTEEPGEGETTTRHECQAHRPQRRPGHRLQRKAWR
jgi:hypothetical protein